MVVVACGVEAVVEELGEGEGRRRSHVVHGLAEQEVVADRLFVAESDWHLLDGRALLGLHAPRLE